MVKYRKKPVEIEAIQWTGLNKVEIESFMDRHLTAYNGGTSLNIPTLEGVMQASPGDFIIKGVNGEFYPCKPDIFEKTYELVQ